MKPAKFYTSILNEMEMSAVRGGNDEPIRPAEVILLPPPPPDVEGEN